MLLEELVVELVVEFIVELVVELELVPLVVFELEVAFALYEPFPFEDNYPPLLSSPACASNSSFCPV